MTGNPEEQRAVQVVMSPAMKTAMEAWLAERGLYLYRIPVEDGLPTYAIADTPFITLVRVPRPESAKGARRWQRRRRR